MDKFDNEIWAYALKNAIEYDKVDAGRIMPKLFRHGLDKKDIGKIMPKISEIVKKVNSMAKEQRIDENKKYEKYALESDLRKEGELPELQNAVKGKVIMRLAPEPSKYNHIGHALVFLIQSFYAKEYEGKCILRFDDTNPEKSAKEYYDAMKEDLSWLGIKWDEEKIASNDMKNMYELAEKLITKKGAFVCSCSQEEVKNSREKGKECKCRKNSVQENLKEWKLMVSGKYKEGERTLRLVGDMKSNNGVMKDPILFRISFAKHFIQKDKYCVWPTYDFENPIEDALSKVTHVIRTNEFELRNELHEKILNILGLKKPEIREIGRYQITGAETQGRIIRELIESGKIKGWDDPRLVTIKALRRRGFVPEMFNQMARTVGLSKSGGHINPTVMESINRGIIDKTSNRYSFVENPIELKVKNAPKIKEIEVKVHPDSTEKRKIKIGKSIFVTKKDFDEFNGKEIRLLHLYNIKIAGKTSAEFTSEENKDINKINWVSDGVKCKILMPDGEWTEGLAESAIEKLKEGEIIQFERFGFCRLDKKGKKMIEFCYTHK
ncbi:MAG: glutamate--tRNA ligase [archaeon]